MKANKNQNQEEIKYSQVENTNNEACVFYRIEYTDDRYKNTHRFKISRNINIPSALYLDQILSVLEENGKVEKCTQISKDEFSKNCLTVGRRIERFEGAVLPDNWLDVAIEKLSWSGIYTDKIGYNEDLCKMVNQELDPENPEDIKFIMDHMDWDYQEWFDEDCRLLYGLALLNAAA